MEYFTSHIGVIFGAALFVAACALIWWFSMLLSEKRRRERAEVRRVELAKRQQAEKEAKMEALIAEKKGTTFKTEAENPFAETLENTGEIMESIDDTEE